MELTLNEKDSYWTKLIHARKIVMNCKIALSLNFSDINSIVSNQNHMKRIILNLIVYSFFVSNFCKKILYKSLGGERGDSWLDSEK